MLDLLKQVVLDCIPHPSGGWSRLESGVPVVAKRMMLTVVGKFMPHQPSQVLFDSPNFDLGSAE